MTTPYITRPNDRDPGGHRTPAPGRSRDVPCGTTGTRIRDSVARCWAVTRRTKGDVSVENLAARRAGTRLAIASLLHVVRHRFGRGRATRSAQTSSRNRSGRDGARRTVRRESGAMLATACGSVRRTSPESTYSSIAMPSGSLISMFCDTVWSAMPAIATPRASRSDLVRRSSSVESTALKATWNRPGLLAGASGASDPTATVAKSWWWPSEKHASAARPCRAAIGRPRTCS